MTTVLFDWQVSTERFIACEQGMCSCNSSVCLSVCLSVVPCHTCDLRQYCHGIAYIAESMLTQT